ncbi:MAG TPA: hypothetical protein VF665_09445 [Longimicrobium sp.]|jgi:hypothetical protein|uniref:hypothetical protein n=1 Tax=Longimicrobium sp. TaxID=2029185 RepID=UPI002ED8131D
MNLGEAIEHNGRRYAVQRQSHNVSPDQESVATRWTLVDLQPAGDNSDELCDLGLHVDRPDAEAAARRWLSQLPEGRGC